MFQTRIRRLSRSSLNRYATSPVLANGLKGEGARTILIIEGKPLKEDRGATEKSKPVDVENPDLESDESGFYVRMFKHDFSDPPWRKPAGKTSFGVVLTSHMWGDQDEELGRVLMHDFLQTLGEKKELPQWIFLVNAGVRIGLKGADGLDLLQNLESLGVKILVSKTSLYHFGVETELRVGEAVTMFDMVAAIHRAEKLISL